MNGFERGNGGSFIFYQFAYLISTGTYTAQTTVIVQMESGERKRKQRLRYGLSL